MTQHPLPIALCHIIKLSGFAIAASYKHLNTFIYRFNYCVTASVVNTPLAIEVSRDKDIQSVRYLSCLNF